MRSIQFPGLPDRAGLRDGQRKPEQIIHIQLDPVVLAENGSVRQKKLPAGEGVRRLLYAVPETPREIGCSALHPRSIREHSLPLQVRDVVEVEIDGQPLRRTKAEVQGGTPLEGKRLSQEGVARYVGGHFPEPDDLLERDDLESGLGGAALQILEARVHRPRPADQESPAG